MILEPPEYVLELSTGEVLGFAELDPEAYPPLADPGFLKEAGPVLRLCTYAPREALEDAKRGYTEPLEGLLGTPPAGCLLRLAVPACAEARSCPSWDPSQCSAARRAGGRPDFPACWSFAAPGHAGAFSTFVVNAWRDGRYVLVAGERPASLRPGLKLL